jgi:penicillin-binding protein 2
MMFTDPAKNLYPGFHNRIVLTAIVMVLFLIVLIFRLWNLQIVRWDEFRAQSRDNQLRVQRLEPSRGMIYGRNGNEKEVVFADNRAARDLVFIPAECDVEPELVCNQLSQLIQLDYESLVKKIKKAQESSEPYKHILIQKDIPRSVAASISERSYALPGVITVVRPVRRYIYGETAGQLIGYLGEVSKKELDAADGHYRMGDLVGRAGLERKYEERLHGEAGEMLVTQFATGEPQIKTDPYGDPYVEVDSHGHNLETEKDILAANPGEDIQLTLDIGLQQKSEELLAGEEGSIVVLNSDTGEVLALASTPGYDPGVFVSPNQAEERMKILRSKPNQMIHRAYQEVYPPGSTFKVLMAIAALEEGVIDENTEHTCWGRYQYEGKGRVSHCWRRVGHGKVKIIDALAFSCDVFFYNVGVELGVDNIKKWSDRLGWGEKTGLDMPGEASGLIPSRDWKKKLFQPRYPKEPWEWKWYPGDTVNLSIGQGSANATPLQVAVLMASVVNGGKRVTPFLNEANYVEPSEILFNERTARIVREGLQKCVDKGPPAPTGTGHATYREGVTILGKTGSAQIMNLSHHEKYETEEDIPKDFRDHAWFMAGVTNKEPRIAIGILVEHGHHGSSAASPLAGEIIDYYYGQLENTEKIQIALDVEGNR